MTLLLLEHATAILVIPSFWISIVPKKSKLPGIKVNGAVTYQTMLILTLMSFIPAS